MNVLLVIAFLGLAVSFLRYRKQTRDRWRQIGHIIDAIDSGSRPSSFILHGEADLRRIGFGLERLVNQRNRLQSQISREGINLQAILASMVEGVMVVDNSRTIRLVNDSFLNLFQLSENPVGRRVIQVLRDASIETVLRDALSSGSPLSQEISTPASDRHFVMSAAPLHDPTKDLLGIAVTFHEITRIKQLEQMRRDFVANVSHELRTPLSIFQGYLEFMQDAPDLPREDLKQALEVLQKHSSRLNTLVTDLLALSGMESGQHQLQRIPVCVPEFLGNIQRDWKLKFNARNVAIEVDSDDGVFEIAADPFRLEQVFNNLLDNALKYTPKHGKVVITTRRDDPELEIRVTDTGSGIPTEHLPHVFERFYRVDPARSRALGGTGLGLSIVKHIIQAHGGTVRAESTPGLGSSIILRLPLASV